MVKHTLILRQIGNYFLSVFDHFVGLVLKGLKVPQRSEVSLIHAAGVFLYPLKTLENL